MKFKYCLSAAVIGVVAVFVQPVFQALSQERSGEFTSLQSLLEAKKWDEADKATISLIRNDSENLSCPNLNSIDQLWMKYSNGKYGFTPQIPIWQKVGGFKCKTCEHEIEKFSAQLGWNLSDQVSPQPGNFAAQYPTVATLGWQHYVNSGSSILSPLVGGGPKTWQAWRVNKGFNLFSILKNCQGQQSTRQ